MSINWGTGKKLWYNPSVIKRNKLITHVTTGVNLKSIMTKKRSQIQKTPACIILFIHHFRKGKTIGTENKAVIPRDEV